MLPTPTPPFPPQSHTAHALHARLLSWFLDAPAAPFGVHRMALAGKAAGKDVGMWFGPSAAAGALRTLVDAFPACGLGVSVATDGTLYQTEVYAASHSPHSAVSSSAASVSSSGSHDHGKASSHGHGRGSSSGHSHAQQKARESKWGDRPVLLLLGIRLGLDGVNPIYYETIKLLYTFPQSVGIAGGRPSSSYYFVGVQGDGLFYLDPHHSRPSVPLRPFMGDASSIPRPPSSPGHGHAATSSSHAREHRSLSPEAAAYARGGSSSPEGYVRAGSMSPDFVYARGGSMSPDFGPGNNSPMTEDELFVLPRRASSTTDHDTARAPPAGGHLTPAEQTFYAGAYSAAELRTFHCERVRKMPLSGLDPSMLIGFVCRSEEEWVDLRRRVKELPRTIFSIQDEPPTWPGADDDDDMGLESVSDPEEELVDDGDISSASHAPSSSVSHEVSSASHAAASAFSHTHAHHNSNSTTSTTTTKSSSTTSSGTHTEDTEDDAVAPITPLPGSRFDLSSAPPLPGKEGTVGDAYTDLEGEDSFVDAGGEVDIEDDWVDPVAPSPPPPVKKGSKGKGKSKSRKAVPVPSVHYPFPVSVEDGPPSPPTRERERERAERERMVTVSPSRVAAAAGTGGGQRMHTARARDGGRTQSGGVRGVLTED
ncbi:hypothetical protein C8R47DRAFT_1324442 [Mycena vitilis]|nr:hypothetical protein C8R47DRAFT_1324442 [Mycena vitilis]